MNIVNFEDNKLCFRQSKTARFILAPIIALRRRNLNAKQKTQNQLLANIAELVGEEVVLKINGYGGNFIVGTDSDLFRIIATSGSYESHISKVCAKHLNLSRDIADVGANIGLYSVMFAHKLKGKRVLAIEPTPGALSKLRRNLELNQVQDGVVVFEGVASDEHGEAEVKIVSGREEYTSMGNLVHPAIAGMAHETLKVPSLTLDELADMHGLDLGFVKIDVEGMEHKVLRGMTSVLSNHRPVVLAELSDSLLRSNGSSASWVVDYLRGYGYTVQDAHDSRVSAGLRLSGEILCLPPGGDHS